MGRTWAPFPDALDSEQNVKVKLTGPHGPYVGLQAKMSPFLKKLMLGAWGRNKAQLPGKNGESPQEVPIQGPKGRAGRGLWCLARGGAPSLQPE